MTGNVINVIKTEAPSVYSTNSALFTSNNVGMDANTSYKMPNGVSTSHITDFNKSTKRDVDELFLAELEKSLKLINDNEIPALEPPPTIEKSQKMINMDAKSINVDRQNIMKTGNSDEACTKNYNEIFVPNEMISNNYNYNSFLPGTVYCNVGSFSNGLTKVNNPVQFSTKDNSQNYNNVNSTFGQFNLEPVRHKDEHYRSECTNSIDVYGTSNSSNVYKYNDTIANVSSDVKYCVSSNVTIQDRAIYNTYNSMDKTRTYSTVADIPQGVNYCVNSNVEAQNILYSPYSYSGDLNKRYSEVADTVYSEIPEHMYSTVPDDVLKPHRPAPPSPYVLGRPQSMQQIQRRLQHTAQVFF